MVVGYHHFRNPLYTVFDATLYTHKIYCVYSYSFNFFGLHEAKFASASVGRERQGCCNEGFGKADPWESLLTQVLSEGRF